MNELLQLKSLRVDSVIETPTSFEVTAGVITRAAACPGCAGRIESKGRGEPMEVWDTPAAGKHVRIQLQGRRYRCLSASCSTKTFTDRGSEVHPKHGVTVRLREFIRSLAFKWSVKDIARLTGATSDEVWPIVRDLAISLQGHKFPTPRIVAVDDIRFGKKRRYTVISDGETGNALGIVERLDAKGVGKKLHEVIDPSQAEIFVSDMNGSNIRLAGSSFKGKPHVADKWHVLQKMQKPLSKVINQAVAAAPTGQGAELKSWKPELEGRYAAADARRRRAALSGMTTKQSARETAQDGLRLKSRMDVVKAHRPVRMVYHARLLLRHVYRAASRRQAEERFDRFLCLCASAGMPEEAVTAAINLATHRTAILAYFDVIERHHDGRFRGPTTNLAEARNGKIKEMWKRSRGIQNEAYLNMRVVFEPYDLRSTLLICRTCGQTEVLSDLDGLRRAGMNVREAAANCCSTCSEGLIKPLA